VGIGPDDPDRNPFLNANLPILTDLLGGDLPVLGAENVRGTAVAFPLDPLMSTPGLPQSGTGHTALLTGENAARLYGRHFGPWVPVPLRAMMMEKNILSMARKAGLSCSFANAYPRKYHELAWSKRPAGPPLAAHGAGVLTRSEVELSTGQAVSSEIVNTTWRTSLGYSEIPEITEEEAGRNLARISRQTSLTLFAHYRTDTAGHERSLEAGVAALERLDTFLGGLLPELSPHTLLLLASDHGNIEDITAGHTTNPTLNILMGPGAEAMAGDLSGITDLASAVLAYLTQRP
jgi:hypothetical protein